MSRTRTAIATALAALGIAAAAAPAQAYETWTRVGGPISDGPVAQTDFDLKRIEGAPHVAWSDGGDGGRLHVARQNSSGGWTRLGGAVNHDPANATRGPSLVAGPGDQPWVGWMEQEQENFWRVRVARWDPADARWVEIAPHSLINRVDSGADRALFSAHQVKIVFFGEGLLHVLFRQDNPSAFELGHVRLGGDPNNWDRLNAPQHRIEPYNVTAYSNGGDLFAGVWGFPDNVIVDHWTAQGTWEQVGGLASVQEGPDPVRAAGPFALAEHDGALHALWRRHDGDLSVSRFDDGSWSRVGLGFVASFNMRSMRHIGGRLHVAFEHILGDAYSAWYREDGVSWDTRGFPFGQSQAVLTGVNGVPYGAFTDTSAGGRLRVARLDGLKPAGSDDHDDSEPACGRDVYGTRGNDRLTGTAGRDSMHGFRGNDTLRGLNGSDCLFGHEGNDRLEGGDGDDILDGAAGSDRITSGPGFDTVRAGGGDDVVDSRGRGWDTIDCGPGRDRALVGDLDVVRNCERVENVD